MFRKRSALLSKNGYYFYGVNFTITDLIWIQLLLFSSCFFLFCFLAFNMLKGSLGNFCNLTLWALTRSLLRQLFARVVEQNWKWPKIPPHRTKHWFPVPVKLNSLCALAGGKIIHLLIYWLFWTACIKCEWNGCALYFGLTSLSRQHQVLQLGHDWLGYYRCTNNLYKCLYLYPSIHITS